MTVGQFQEIYKVSQTNLSEDDKAIMYVMAMTGKTEDEINRFSLRQFNALCRKVTDSFNLKMYELDESKPKKFYYAGGTLYRFNYDIKRPPFNAGRYIEVATFSNDLIGNLHLIMASMATPYKWLKPVKVEAWQHEHIAKDMKNLDFKIAYHAAVFFYAVFTHSMKALQPYLIAEMAMKMNEETARKTLQDLQTILAGFTMPKWYRNLKLSV